MAIKLLFVFGTRPEAIKMAPLIIEAKKKPKEFNVKVCITGQHAEMLYQVLNFFKIAPDYDLKIMHPDQTLTDITTATLIKLDYLIGREIPDMVLVQGDTTTAFAGALAAFYKKIPIAHVEAGLRSHNQYLPFPEEINRMLIGNLATLHFAPTEVAALNLLQENKSKAKVFIVGNTVIDALHLTTRLAAQLTPFAAKECKEVDFSKKIILVTAHRRENLGNALENISFALKAIAAVEPNIEIIFPLHLNPRVREPVFRILKGIRNIHLISPLDYPDLIYVMNKSFCVITDSGGIQEEAPGLGKPVLIIRDVTERTEGVAAGTCLLVGTNKQKIVVEVNRLLHDATHYRAMSQAKNPYGDGTSSLQILTKITEYYLFTEKNFIKNNVQVYDAQHINALSYGLSSKISSSISRIPCSIPVIQCHAEAPCSNMLLGNVIQKLNSNIGLFAVMIKWIASTISLLTASSRPTTTYMETNELEHNLIEFKRSLKLIKKELTQANFSIRFFKMHQSTNDIYHFAKQELRALEKAYEFHKETLQDLQRKGCATIDEIRELKLNLEHSKIHAFLEAKENIDHYMKRYKWHRQLNVHFGDG